MYEKYKAGLLELFERIENYSKINQNLENRFCNLLAEKLEKLAKEIEKEKLKVVIDSGYIHQYSSLKNELEKRFKKDKIKIREIVEKGTLYGFVEDLVIKTAKGELRKENIEKYSEEIAKSVLFEAMYSPYRMQIHSLSYIDRKKQEEVYKKLLPKVSKWGEKELKKFWSTFRSNPFLRPYLDEDDMEKILKKVGLES